MSGTVALCGQQPCVLNTSVRENILFGQPMHFKRYYQVGAANFFFFLNFSFFCVHFRQFPLPNWPRTWNSFRRTNSPRCVRHSLTFFIIRIWRFFFWTRSVFGIQAPPPPKKLKIIHFWEKNLILLWRLFQNFMMNYSVFFKFLQKSLNFSKLFSWNTELYFYFVFLHRNKISNHLH